MNTVKVLAVDDSKTMLIMLSAQLRGSSFEIVATATNGSEAVEKFKQLKPQLVLLDVIMPEVTGVETLQRLLDLDTAACVVMVSSIGSEAIVQDCLEKGAKSFLQKPLKKDNLLALLERVCQDAGVEL